MKLRGLVMLAGGLRWVWRQMSTTHGLVDPTPKDADLIDKLASQRPEVVIKAEFALELLSPESLPALANLSRNPARGSCRNHGRACSTACDSTQA